jgi:hypothetical protein
MGPASPGCIMRSLFLLGTCIATATAVAAGDERKPLIGGSLTWAINRDFRAGTRQVHLTLKTAWKRSSIPCNHNPGDTVSTCSTPNPEPRERLGRLCFYQCDNKQCEDVRDDVHLNTTFENDFVVEINNNVLGFMSGSMTVTVDVEPQMVGLFAFLCFEEDNEEAVGPLADQWYGVGDETDGEFNNLYPKYAGSVAPQQAGLFYGQTFLQRFESTAGAGSIGRNVKLLSTYIQLCCTTCLVAGEEAETSCDEEKTRIRNYYSPEPNVPLALYLTANAARWKNNPRTLEYKVHDYDGHPLELLPPRVQGEKLSHVSYDRKSLKFADDPAAGPVWYLFRECEEEEEKRAGERGDEDRRRAHASLPMRVQSAMSTSMHASMPDKLHAGDDFQGVLHDYGLR